MCNCQQGVKCLSCKRREKEKFPRDTIFPRARPAKELYQAVYDAMTIAGSEGNEGATFALKAILRELQYQEGFR